jgi:hypothetical protein
MPSFLSLGWCSARLAPHCGHRHDAPAWLLELPLAFLAACHVRVGVLVIPAALVTCRSRRVP